MLVGQHKHKLDSKSRLSLPAKLRKELGNTIIVTHGLDQCLFVYPTKEWKNFSHRISELSMGQADTRAFTRFMLSSAVEVEVDKSGRILIPDHLRTYAKLDEQVVIAGVYNRLELWGESAWDEYIKSVTSRADVLAERLGEIGML